MAWVSNGDNFWHFGQEVTSSCRCLSTTVPLKGSSGRRERRFGWDQDVQDAIPEAFFAPAEVSAGHRGPWPEVFRQLAPGRAGADHPEHALHDQAMIDGWPTRLRLLRGQERLQLLPALVGERRDSQQAQGSRWV